VVTLIAFIFVEAQSGTNDAAHSVSFADFQRGKLADVPIVRLGGAYSFPFNDTSAATQLPLLALPSC